MPTYEYACKSCGRHLEVQQSFSDAPLTTCPTCEGPLRKVFGNIAISFKGSGFYSTDSRAGAKGSSTATKTDGGGDKEKSSGSDGSGSSGTSAGTSKSGDSAGGKATSGSAGSTGSKSGEKAAASAS